MVLRFLVALLLVSCASTPEPTPEPPPPTPTPVPEKKCALWTFNLGEGNMGLMCCPVEGPNDHWHCVRLVPHPDTGDPMLPLPRGESE